MEKLEVYYLANKSDNLYFTLLGDVSSSKKETEEKDERAAMIEDAKMNAVEALVNFMALAFDAEDGEYDELFEAMRVSMSEVLDEVVVANAQFIAKFGKDFGIEKEVKTTGKKVKTTKTDDVDAILKAFVSML